MAGDPVQCGFVYKAPSVAAKAPAEMDCGFTPAAKVLPVQDSPPAEAAVPEDAPARPDEPAAPPEPAGVVWSPKPVDRRGRK